MKRLFCLFILFFALPGLACRQRSGAATPTPAIQGDAFFSGRAFQDSNANGQLDPDDQPLAGARFTAGYFGALTNEAGYAQVVIPGGWSQPLTARMDPPAGCGCTPVGPAEATLQTGVQTGADFLFTAPQVSPDEKPASAGSPAVTPPPAPAPSAMGTEAPSAAAPGAVLKDLTYCTTSAGVALKMDLHYPQPFTASAPLVMYVHGGGWTGGDKAQGAGTRFISDLLEHGYIVTSINYRLAPEYVFPAAIEDVRCAVRHLRANAARYGLDPARVGLIGGSAGGHLVALLGTAGDGHGWPAESYQEDYAAQSSRVQAVVDMFGPADLTGFSRFQNVPPRLRQVFGDDPATMTTYSPVTYITSKAPPFLILHGDQDQLVPLEQSQTLQQRLAAAGVPVDLVVVKNTGHGFVPGGGQPDPNLAQLAQMVVAFYDRYLAK